MKNFPKNQNLIQTQTLTQNSQNQNQIQIQIQTMQKNDFSQNKITIIAYFLQAKIT